MMTDKLIEMAKQAGAKFGNYHVMDTTTPAYVFVRDELEAFANLIRDDERAKFGEPVAWYNPKNFIRTSNCRTPIETEPLYSKKGMNDEPTR
jgi:hypothetical protein